jgi:NADH:ubiquinone oxidoreductase subunit
MSSSLIRTIRNIINIGPKRYWNQLNTIGDAKAGKLIGEDSYGNKYYENDYEDEIHLRTRWVEYKDGREFNISQVEPAWHFWLGYGVDLPPNQTPKEFTSIRAYPTSKHTPAFTGTPGAYIPYNTVKPKISSWNSTVAPRN